MQRQDVENFIKYINYKEPYDIINFSINYKNVLKEKEKDIIVNRMCCAIDAYYIWLLIDEVNWLTKKHINSLINSVIKNNEHYIFSNFIDKCTKLSDYNITTLVLSITNTNNAKLIYEFYNNVKKISKKNKIHLIKTLIETNDYEYILEIAKDVSSSEEKEYINLLIDGILNSNNLYYIYEFSLLENLSQKHIDSLVDKILSFNNAKYIYSVASDCKKLSPSNIDLLVKGIINSNDSLYMYKFLTKVKNLNTDYYIALTDKLFELKDFDVMKKMIDDYLNGSYHKKIGADFEKRILNTKDLLIITYYLIKTNNKNLIKLFFETTEKFLVFILLHKELLDINEEFTCKLAKDINFNDTNLNMKEYVKSNKNY